MIPEKAAFRSTDSNPFFLTASTTVSSNSGGGVNSAALKNPTGGPMELLEIRWQVKTTGFNSSVGGAYLGCKLDLGKIPLTNGFVPVWSFYRADNLFQEVVQGLALSLTSYCTYTWRLPRPLYVPAGAVVVPTFQHRGFFQQPIAVKVSYSCRTVSPNSKPSRASIPYAAYFASKMMRYDLADIDSSSETDLTNGFSEPIQLQAFTGRVAVVDYGTGLTAFEASQEGGRDLLLRMVDLNGRPIVRSFAPFRQVFGATTRSWDLGHGEQLSPSAYYLVSLQKNVPAATLGAAFFIQAFVGLAGWREVVFSPELEKRSLEGIEGE
jgi:hypothetical protein